MTDILIGKNSYLASTFIQSIKTDGWLFLSHQEIDDHTNAISNASRLINFAFDPVLHTQNYDVEHDIDSQIADMVGPETHYIMISTRMVYGESSVNLEPFRETDSCNPVTIYGLNKRIIENELQKKFPRGNLTILRPSNIFGFEPGRATFMGTAQARLKDRNEILFDIAPGSKRDFLPLAHFASMVKRITENPVAGIYNLGSGIGTSCEEIANWLIEGYGTGNVVYTDNSTKGQFVLDMVKTIHTYGFQEITKEDLQTQCIECGRKLRYC